MFKFLKEKLKSWLGKSKEEIEETGEKIEEKKAEPQKEEKKERKGEEKEQKSKETREEKREKERKVSDKVIEDLKREKVEIKTPEEKFEEEIEREERGAEQEEAEMEGEQASEEKAEKKKGGFFERLKSIFAYKLTQSKFEDIFSELETLLLENNVALEVVEKLKKDLEKSLVEKELKKSQIEAEIKSALKSALEDIIIDPDNIIESIKEIRKTNKNEPFKILFFGINGTGKTTAIAKLASLLKKSKLSCVMAAADTFRAASIEQLQIHADRLGVKMIKNDYGSDPSSVAFDAIKYAKANHLDVVLIDTAGRMHTKENLLKEMEKICRVTKPDLKIFIAEAIAGNDAIEQAKAFNEAIGIDGSILTKTDVDEKGGTIISISYITKKPIFYLGTGQGYSDLELFDKEKFIERLGL